MAEIKKKEFLIEMEDQMNSAGFMTRIEEVDGIEMLRIIVDELGSDKKGSVLLEVCFLPLDDEGIPDDLSALQMFTTIVNDIEEDKLPGIYEQLNEINLECILGGFNVFKEQMQLFHKYVCMAHGYEVEDLMNTVQPAFNWILSTIHEIYEELIEVCRK